MSVSNEINRLINAKAAIKQSIVNKGVDVSDSALLDEYPALIDSISGGGVEGEPPYKMWWNAATDNGTRCAYLFYGCKSITSLNLSDFDTSNVTDMQYMFYNCTNLTTLDVSNWNTSNVTSMLYMFANCNQLTSLDVSNWNTSKVTTMKHMFYWCDKLTSLDVNNFDTSNVTNMSYMFCGCNNLTSLDLSNFDTSKVTNMTYMFSGCNKLIELNMSNCDISKVTSSSNISGAFSSCTALVDFQAPKNISANMDVSSSTALSHDSLMSIINNLITTTSSKTLTLGATNLAKLTADEIAIATNKGWTVK